MKVQTNALQLKTTAADAGDADKDASTASSSSGKAAKITTATAAQNKSLEGLLPRVRFMLETTYDLKNQVISSLLPILFTNQFSLDQAGERRQHGAGEPDEDDGEEAAQGQERGPGAAYDVEHAPHGKGPLVARRLGLCRGPL